MLGDVAAQEEEDGEDKEGASKESFALEHFREREWHV